MLDRATSEFPDIGLRNPSPGPVAVARTVIIDIWQMRISQSQESKKALGTQIRAIDTQIDALLDRIVGSSNASAVGNYEKRIEKLEREKLLLAEKAAQNPPQQARLEKTIEHALRFLASPWKIYRNGCFSLKRTVLKLAFEEPLRYKRFEGYRTAETTIPFKVLETIHRDKNGLVQESKNGDT